jgi:hypothetical protein
MKESAIWGDTRIVPILVLVCDKNDLLHVRVWDTRAKHVATLYN